MIEIRTIRDDELVDYLRIGGMGFLDRTDPAGFADEVRPIWDLSRNHAAFDDGRLCGTFRSWASELTVPGAAQLPASCIAGVAVIPTHRRRGILGRLVAAEEVAARERGEVVALLYASEYPIYGRFGYGPGTRQATFTLDTRKTAFHPVTLAGAPIDMVVPDAGTRDTLMGIHDAWRRLRHGELRRRPQSWDFDLGLRTSVWGTWRGFVAVHRDAAGAPDGYARFIVEERWQDRQPANVLKLDELHALSDDASAALWQFLAGLDWVTTIVAPRRAPSDRLPWTLTNARAAVMSEVGDALWVHLLDIPRALAARTYAGEGRLTVEVVDSDVRTRIALDVAPDGATATPTRTSPDVTVAAAVLGAAYLGGTRLRDAAVALGSAGAEEHRPGAIATLEGWLRTADEPWCSTFF